MPKSTITAIIVDDEPHARQAMERALTCYEHIKIIAQCEHGLAAVKAVNEHKPDVMFLDIHMPKLDGFDVLDLLGNDAPTTVFVTAYDEYAIQAFEANALDYVLKPISQERLTKTIERLELLLLNHGPDTPNSTQNTDLLAHKAQHSAPIQRVLVRDKSEVHVIPVEDILYIESADDYVIIHTAEHNHIKQERLQNLENTLDPHMFCRIHRSSIININYLAGIDAESKDNKMAIMKNKDRQPVSRAGYQRLAKLL